METNIKTPVEIVQQLIALQTTRKEATDKLIKVKMNEAMAARLSKISGQSEYFIAELMNELSNYGDGSAAVADRENEYHALWNDVSRKVDTLGTEEGEQIFQNMEKSLKNIYEQILINKADLPASLQEIISKQAENITE